MAHIYREKPEIPIPPKGHINHSNAQVSIYDLDNNGHRTGTRIVIGVATSERMMHPNDNFRLMYPELWKKHYGEDVPEHVLNVGLYAALLGLAHKTDIYNLLDKPLGHRDTNAFMDYAMHSIKGHSCAAEPLVPHLQGMVTFSSKANSDSYYSRMFKERIAAKEIDADFRLKWLMRCAANGIKKVWLCIDSSNNDCRIQNSNLADKGHAKSNKNVNVVGYIWAVNAEDGRPVSWWVYNGDMPDCKAFETIINFLGASDIAIEGVIVDKGFASQAVVDSIREQGFEYVVKITNGSKAHKEMLEEHADDIRMNVEKAFIANNRVLFGVTDQKKIFESDDRNSTIGLYYDCINGAERCNYLIAKVITTIKTLKQNINKDYKVVVPSEFKKYIGIECDKDGIPVDITIDKKYWQKLVNHTGFSSIACSLPLDAESIDHLYNLRDVSEKQFSILKSQLGFHATRVHSDASIKSRFLAGFVSSILRTELELICQNLELDTNVIIQKLNRVSLLLMSDGRYHAVRNLSSDLKLVLAECGISEESFDAIANEVNCRNLAVHSEYRDAPFSTVQPKKPGRPSKLNDELKEKVAQAVKRGPGRPKGSKNKKTLEREQAEATAKQEEKRGPGRPKGSKNKKTLEREQAEAAAKKQEEKRGPGRPKGSKNKKTLEREQAEAAAKKQEEKRGPGRPKGSKNKKTLEREQAEAAAKKQEEKRGEAAAKKQEEKRGPGRPKGSKNKKTLEREQAEAAAKKQEEKRGPGRPKGSKNKATESDDASKQIQTFYVDN